MKENKGKKVTIFDLYEKEKIISHTDDLNLTVRIRLVKMTQRERKDALETYTEVLEQEREKLEKRDEKAVKSSIGSWAKEQLIEGIVKYEQIQREAFLDLLPIENEKQLSPKDLKSERNKELEKWNSSRREGLGKLSQEELQERLLEITRESSATMEAGRAYDFACLSFMCREEKDEHQRIFSSDKEVEKIKDSRIIEWLLRELADFRKFSAPKEVREAAETPPFPSSGVSQKDSTDSPPSVT